VTGFTGRRQFLAQQAGMMTALFGAIAEDLGAAGGPGTQAAPSPQTASKKKPTALVADPLFKEHDTGEGHPERPERFDAVMQRLTAAKFYPSLKRIETRHATDDEIALCHGRGYISAVRQDVAAGASALRTGDTAISERSLEVAIEAVGGVLNAVDAVMNGDARNAFCAVRPPGHHATPNRGMGFCIFNNVAVAARYAQKHHGAGRVLIADWDVHHGNGTQDCFYDDGTVLFMSAHQSPWYPGTGMSWETGKSAGRGTTLNCPFPAGAGREEILGAFRNKLLPAAKDFKPDVVFLSAGFDSRLGDPLGRFTLSDDDFVELTGVMLEIADTHAGGRLISLLEGGYALDGLASAAARHVETLCGAQDARKL
jgi:acetoin utilization deacetylase AcuC-like enzyme